MTPSVVCFDALGTSFTLAVLVDAVQKVMGERLSSAGRDARTVVLDWFHSAQRDYTAGSHPQYMSITRPPPPTISTVLTLTLPRALASALSGPLPLSPPLPDLTPIITALGQLSPAPALSRALTRLEEANVPAVIVTNGSASTTKTYVARAGLEGLVRGVVSCDEVGRAKPFPEVYAAAHQACDEHTEPSSSGKDTQRGDRWFVAAHLWDMMGARKAGFKTGYVFAEQPPSDAKQEKEFWDMYGGRPDIVAPDLASVVEAILSSS